MGHASNFCAFTLFLYVQFILQNDILSQSPHLIPLCYIFQLLVSNNFSFSWELIQSCFLFSSSQPYEICFCISLWPYTPLCPPHTLDFFCCFQIHQIYSMSFRTAVSSAYTFHSSEHPRPPHTFWVDFNVNAQNDLHRSSSPSCQVF